MEPPVPLVTPCSSAVDPFWRAYPQHLEAHVQEILQKYRIGTVHPEDVALGAAALKERSSAASDPYLNDPPRSPIFITRCEKPFNGEPPPQLLADNWITPTELLFIRNHLPVPEVDAAAYRLEILGDGLRDGVLKLSLHELKALFERVEVTSVLQCAGNRRSDMSDRAKGTRGLAWGIGAIGNVQVRSFLFLFSIRTHCLSPGHRAIHATS
jgi:sulfite oxidase